MTPDKLDWLNATHDLARIQRDMESWIRQEKLDPKGGISYNVRALGQTIRALDFYIREHVDPEVPE